MDRGSELDYSVYSREDEDFPQTQRTMRLTMEGPTIEKLVEEVQHVVVHSTTELEVLKLELSDLHNKVENPIE